MVFKSFSRISYCSASLRGTSHGWGRFRDACFYLFSLSLPKLILSRGNLCWLIPMLVKHNQLAALSEKTSVPEGPVCVRATAASNPCFGNCWAQPLSLQTHVIHITEETVRLCGRKKRCVSSTQLLRWLSVWRPDHQPRFQTSQIQGNQSLQCSRGSRNQIHFDSFSISAAASG